ncbi:ABC transporter transmembrane domain-containing protein [Kitasatospora sp. NPDC052896]|uniref:ABC transporter transmembrane domain-containing protein n=1 Tax=Kitasatospora sp. NPDC052896 TaxID=3364061 RepID=UPI0037C70AF6
MRYDPGEPEPVADRRSPGHFLRGLARRFRVQLTWAVLLGVACLLAEAMMPTVLGRAIDAGIAARDQSALLLWGGALLLLGLGQAAFGILRDRCARAARLGATYSTVSLVTRQVSSLGDALSVLVPAGEVISVGVADLTTLGRGLEVLPRGVGAAVSSAVVAVVMLDESPELGLLVLLGVPLLAWTIARLLRPLHRRQERLRTRQGELTGLAVDIAAGLRVLRGIGGEELFLAGYRAESQRVRRAGVQLARVEALLDAAKVLLPGLLVALVVWLGARDVLAGRLTAGQLVAFYGYAVFLAPQLRRLTQLADLTARARVAAARVVGLLTLTPGLTSPATATAEPPLGAAALEEPGAGLLLPAGRFTAIACAAPGDALLLADRLGRYTDSAARCAGVRLDELPLDEVRRRILVLRNDALLFSGPLRTELDPADRGAPGDRLLTAALGTAAAHDIVAALPDGLDGVVADSGREFSGGQQQRLRLARALMADPEVLVLVEPTSAVDAHTEARIARRLAADRAGRTTVAFTTSPLLLDRADRVLFVADTKVLAEGTHVELLADQRYRSVVTRGVDQP